MIPSFLLPVVTGKPAAACNTWRALWHGLAALEQDAHQHIHLGNNMTLNRTPRLVVTLLLQVPN